MQALHIWATGGTPPSQVTEILQRNAGVFPQTMANAWCSAYVNALYSMDACAAGWFAPTKEAEASLLSLCAPRAPRFPLRSLEPYYVAPEFQWTRVLKGKVAVVSSFTKTIRKQLVKPIWKDQEFLPNVEWHFVQTGYSPTLAAGRGDWPEGIDTWEKALEYMVDEVIQSGAKIALIGCGGLGMVLAGRLKARGISAIVLGGAIQVLFGIKGRRWANHDVISTFWNEHWVWPSEEEIPNGAVLVEGACYW